MTTRLRHLLAQALDTIATVADHLAGMLDGPPRWCWHVTDDGTHFYPLLDSVVHDATDDCVCGPTARLEQCEEHGDTWHWRHHPLTQPDVEDA